MSMARNERTRLRPPGLRRDKFRLSNGGSSIRSQLIAPSGYGQMFGYWNVAHAEEWVSRGARFVPRFKCEIDEARRGIRMILPSTEQLRGPSKRGQDLPLEWR